MFVTPGILNALHFDNTLFHGKQKGKLAEIWNDNGTRACDRFAVSLLVPQYAPMHR